MIPQVRERFFECLDRPEVRRIALQEQIVERVVNVRGELERIVFSGPQPRQPHAEFVFDLLTRSHDVHDT